MELKMISDLSFLEKAYAFAVLASAAYKDDCRKEFEDLGLTNYVFFDNAGAQAHAASNAYDIIITCRGTQPTKINDLLADLDTIPKRHGRGFVHEGFRREARKVLPMIFNYINHYPNRKIWVTGHSLGAAMATYIMQELEYANLDTAMLFTYGSPRLGSHDYVQDFKTEHHRFVNCNDMVTTVPPPALGFRHHGKLHYINFYGNIRDLSWWQRFKDKWRAHKRSWSKGQWFDGLYDHGMDHYIEKIKNIDPAK
jgi:triacylglycerol lipase